MTFGQQPQDNGQYNPQYNRLITTPPNSLDMASNTHSPVTARTTMPSRRALPPTNTCRRVLVPVRPPSTRR